MIELAMPSYWCCNMCLVKFDCWEVLKGQREQV